MCHAGFPKGPCSYIAYTQAPKRFPYYYLRAQVYTIQPRGVGLLESEATTRFDIRTWQRYSAEQGGSPCAAAAPSF